MNRTEEHDPMASYRPALERLAENNSQSNRPAAGWPRNPAVARMSDGEDVYRNPPDGYALALAGRIAR